MYFEKPGKVNTEKTLTLACERGRELGIDEIVLATSTGATAQSALKICKDFKITAVTYHCGWKEPFKHLMDARVREELTASGVAVVAATRGKPPTRN